MTTPPQPKGPWIHRFLIALFTVILAVLVYWVLGFLVGDIASIQGPRFDEIETSYVDQALVAREKALRAEIAEVDLAISNKREEMRILSDSARNLQETIRQLIELQKLSARNTVSMPETRPVNLSEALARFLDSQEQYQAGNTELSKLVERKQQLTSEKKRAEQKIKDQQEPARKAFQRLREKHDLRLALFQLLILLPLLVTGGFLMLRKRDSIYFPLFLGYGAAVLVKVALVIHAYFPSRYFKYVLVVGLLAAVVRLLIYFIRGVAFPKTRWLSRQYREAYERFLCPVCEYPIRTGPRKYLYWTRRTVNRIVLPKALPDETPYTCPACGTPLFEECSQCHGIRHALLPFCRHCGAGKNLAVPLDDSVKISSEEHSDA